jgi:hypothetical protein
MSSRIKNIFGLVAIAALLVLTFAVNRYVDSYSQSIEPGSFRSFAVSAEGEVVTVPDVAEFTFSVLTEGGKNIADLQKQNTDKMNAAIGFLKSQGVVEKDIETKTYNLTPRYQSYSCGTPRLLPDGEVSPCPPPEIAGYSIHQTVGVKIRDFSKIGPVLGGVVQKGANSVSELSFTVDDPESLQDEAREEAIAKAKEKAKSVARAGGFDLGRLLSIDEGGGYAPVPYFARAGFGGELADSKSIPTIEPGSEEIKVTVTLRYEIE